MPRECGSCSLCCKLLAISDMEPAPKPAGKWCPSCAKGQGCAIYANRPPSCRGFECLWLQAPSGYLPDKWRPDRIKVVLCPMVNGAVVARCDPAWPVAWREPELLLFLKRLAKAGYPVHAEAGTRYWIITESTEWELPESCKERLENGMVILHVPDAIKQKIGLYVRPECRTLGNKVELDWGRQAVDGRKSGEGEDV